MDLNAFYATVSGIGFTLIGLWWVVVDKHPEWFRDPVTARMAYVVSLHFMIPAGSSLLSLVAPEKPVVWRAVFVVMGLSGVVGAILVGRTLGAVRRSFGTTAMVLALPVYVLVVLVALAPKLSSLVNLLPLQVEAFLVAAVLLLGLHAVWFFTHPPEAQSRKAASTSE